MKKFLSIVLTIFMLFSNIALSSCKNNNTNSKEYIESEIIGTWQSDTGFVAEHVSFYQDKTYEMLLINRMAGTNTWYDGTYTIYEDEIVLYNINWVNNRKTIAYQYDTTSKKLILEDYTKIG